MNIRGTLKYRKALIIKPESIDALENLLLKYFNKIEYEATTYNDLHISFDSKEELLNYDNFSNRRIKFLSIECRSKNTHVNIELEYFDAPVKFIGYHTTCKCYYSFDSIDTESLFKKEITEFLEKNKAPYWLFGKISFWGLLCILSNIVGYIGMVLKTDNSKTLLGKDLIICTAAAIILLVIIALLDKKIIFNLFTPIVFIWGEEEKRQSKYKRLRTNIVWGIIVAIVVGIITTVITNKIL